LNEESFQISDKGGKCAGEKKIKRQKMMVLSSKNSDIEMNA
jgi:hypothetical protein